MNIHFPFRRQALAGALVLLLAAACQPAPQAPTATPNLNFAPSLPAPTDAAPAATLASEPTVAATATAAPTATFTTPASDFSTLPDPLAGWQMGDRSVPITITEYGDFQ